MAHGDLIGDYLGAVARRLGADSTDLVDELEDHLREKVDRYVAVGTSLHDAQQRAIEQFGPARLIALGLMESETEGAHVSTRFTRAAGWAGVVAVASIGAFVFASAVSIGFGVEFSDALWTPFWLLMGVGMLSFGAFSAGVGLRGGNRVIQVAAPAIVAIGAVAWFVGDFENAGVWMPALLATMIGLRLALPWRSLVVLAGAGAVMLVWTTLALVFGRDDPTVVEGSIGTLGFAVLLSCVLVASLRLVREDIVERAHRPAMTPT